MVNREEREIRKEYKREWCRTEDLVKKNSREWKKLKERVGSEMERKRNIEIGRLNKKREWLITKVGETKRKPPKRKAVTFSSIDKKKTKKKKTQKITKDNFL